MTKKSPKIAILNHNSQEKGKKKKKKNPPNAKKKKKKKKRVLYVKTKKKTKKKCTNPHFSNSGFAFLSFPRKGVPKIETRKTAPIFVLKKCKKNTENR
jgi:hypothetical protein